MVHKLIKKTTEEWIIPKDEKEIKQLTKIETPEKELEEKETDVMDDYDEGMKEFLESLGGKEETKKIPKKEIKTEEIRALGD